MRISSGLSEIQFHANPSGRIPGERIYLWPAYGEGKVDRIQGVTRRTEGNALYSKPLPEDREKLLGMIESSGSSSYDSGGRVRNSLSGLRPGSFFDAVV